MTDGFSRLHVGGPGGHTTSPDVRLLIENWPKLSQGQTILHTDIERVISTPRIQGRYRSVVESWRKRLYREFNITLGAVPNTGYVVLDNHERVNLSSSKVKSGLRKIRRGGDIANRTDKTGLTDAEIRVCDHLVRVKALMTDAYSVESRALRVTLKDITAQP